MKSQTTLYILCCQTIPYSLLLYMQFKVHVGKSKTSTKMAMNYTVHVYTVKMQS